jgi:hypothetical protein
MAQFLGLSLDPATHDLHLTGAGELATVTDNEAIAQHTKQRLMFYEGEWFLDLTAGTPWFQYVFVRPHNDVVIESVIKRQILGTPGVAELLSFEMRVDPNRRAIEVLEAVALSTLDDPLEISL